MLMEKNNAQKETRELKERLFRPARVVWDHLEEGEKEGIMALAEDYKRFLDNSKTEREAVREIVAFARAKGFGAISDGSSQNRLYAVHRNKVAALAVLGAQPIEKGMRIIIAHIDSPRLDLKQSPLYEDVNLALMKTHYYGGIKKYQWVNRPLALHGTIIKSDGSSLELRIGEDEGDPVFAVSDLLVHLWRKAQATKKAEEVVEGENLNVIAGSIPYEADRETDQRFKLGLLAMLSQKYGIVEEDFTSAEFEAVPAERARDLGWDRSMIAGYGHDDRACVYAALHAIGEMESSERPLLVLFMDKEETGSDGNTGSHSRFIEYVVGDIARAQGGIEEGALRRALAHSECISADVNAAIDPEWQNLFDKRNAARMGGGVCVTKYSGSGGKYGTSDANAEFVAKIRRILNENKVIWQTGEIGKVDEGGGGTVAKFMAWYGMDVIDAGMPVLGMHSPYEIISKADLYMTYKAYKAFLRNA
ncbi:MAG: aminopeptidase [bacterium]